MKTFLILLSVLLPNFAWSECDKTPLTESEADYFYAESSRELLQYEHRMLASIYNQRKGCREERFKHLVAAAESNNSTDQMLLGLEYMQRGQYQEAEAYLLKAVAQQNPEAMSVLGMLYLRHMNKEKEALPWFRKAEKSGETGAYFFLGAIYFFGKGVPIDSARSIRYWIKGANKGDCASAASLGDVYNIARYRARDVKLATYWYKKAYELGCREVKPQLDQLQE